MPLPKEQYKYTVDDILALPEGERAELLDGKIYDMAPPTATHQFILFELSLTIGTFIKNNKGSCQVALAPFAVFLNDDNQNYVEPDLSVICNLSKIDEKGCHGAPDWIIEIVSPASRKMDYLLKLFKYRSAGVREYWIVDPKRETVLCYYFEGDDYPHMYTFDDIIPVMIYDGKLEINFADIKERLI